MAEFEIKATYIASDLVTVEAETEEEAWAKFEAGEWEGDHNVAYELQDTHGIKRVSD
ncbi:MAG: hypothetical protein GOVbin2937_91 [Prokaryotic dsDNA virus sp.]|nr:MAG: hypothetical protein GOVbin2937_91 [Prokaryotic dsDNA virus sp.]|tara:strand:- start:3064 stop:3234 length:171 start_codon:yes stop_codon:yes gene_type:complete